MEGHKVEKVIQQSQLDSSPNLGDHVVAAIEQEYIDTYKDMSIEDMKAEYKKMARSKKVTDAEKDMLKEAIKVRENDKYKETTERYNERWKVQADARKDEEEFAHQLLRLCYRNASNMYVSNGVLFYKGKRVEKNGEGIRTIANTPLNIPKAAASWVYDNMLELAPKLDESRHQLLPNLIWNTQTQELEETDGKA